jgi:alkaline phosphatase D
MDYSRRRFLQTAGLVMASSALPVWAKGAANFIDPLSNSREDFSRGQIVLPGIPVLQGATDLTSTTILFLHEDAQVSLVKVRDSLGKELPFQTIDSWKLPGSSKKITEIYVTGLIPRQIYSVEFLQLDGSLVDRRTFSSLDLQKKICRFAVASCMRDSDSNRLVTMWNSLQKENCDFVFLVGDTCYADNDNSSRDEAGYARRYAESRGNFSWFRQAKLTPTFATWDDHDFGGNNLDRTFPLADYTRQLFRKFWGTQQNISWRRAHGVGSVFTGFGQRFFLMDDRSFRDPENSRLGRHWGAEQTDWLLAELEKSDTPAWLMNGSQFFGGYLAKESMERDHAEDFRQILQRLSRVPAPVAFVSGDVHFSEIMEIEPEQLGYRTYEFTSSSIHSITFPGHQFRAKNPRRLLSEWKHNFLVFDVNVENGWQIQSRSVMENNAVSFTKNVEINR